MPGPNDAHKVLLSIVFWVVEQDEAKQQDNRNHQRYLALRQSNKSANNQDDRENGPNDCVTDLGVLVPRHRSLSAAGFGLAAR